MTLIKLFLAFGVICASAHEATHWKIDESDLIKPRLDQPFLMADVIDDYDLIGFLLQEDRWKRIKTLHRDLTKMQPTVTRLWNKVLTETNVNVQLGTDHNCKKSAPINKLDWYAAHLEKGFCKHIPPEDYKIADPSYGGNTAVPDCKKVSSLIFSMATFEHLESLSKRHELTISPEAELPELMSPMMKLGPFGHWVHHVLRRNTSSWLHYNLASIYWRVEGNAMKALECSRRAVHYAPREYKDIALLNMGSILHRSKRSADAAIVLRAAVDHDDDCAHSHFMLGNAYSMIGDYNNSLHHFERSLKINPTFEAAKKHRHGVLCMQQLTNKMKTAKRTIAELYNILSDYMVKEVLWLQMQLDFVRNMSLHEDLDRNNVTQVMIKMSELNGLPIHDLRTNGNKNAYIFHYFNDETFKDKLQLATGEGSVNAAHDLESAVKFIEKGSSEATNFGIKANLLEQAGSKVKLAGPLLASSEVEVEEPPPRTEGDISEFEFGPPLYPPSMKVNRNVEDFDLTTDWPSSQLCRKEGPGFSENIEVIYPVFLPFENKGLRFNGLFAKKIGVPFEKEHPLPWRRPLCDSENITDLKKAKKNNNQFPVEKTTYLRQKMMEYITDGLSKNVRTMHDEEIGERINTAMKKGVAPKWLLYAFTALYWRVQLNNDNALVCLLAARKTVQNKYKDVVLISLASVYLEMGNIEDAFQAAEKAYKLSLYEPATNFLLAQLNMVKKQKSAQMSHLKQVIRVEPKFMNGLGRLVLVHWACHLTQVSVIKELESEMCAETESAMNIVCERDGSNCHYSRTPTLYCTMNMEDESSSTILRLINFHLKYAWCYVDVSVLELFIRELPVENYDKEENQESFDLMLKIVNNLRGCDDNGCRSLAAEFLDLEVENCYYDHVTLEYWITYGVFRQLMTNPDISLVFQISSLTPSQKKYPECRAYPDFSEDFFLDKMRKVGVDGWTQLPSVAKLFSELFESIEFNSLGAKIAKYLEHKPRCWRGLLWAGWWCGIAGRGACAVRCLQVSLAHTPQNHGHHALRSLAALVQLQGKYDDGIMMASLAFYSLPKNPVEAFLMGTAHAYKDNYQQTFWMFKYALGLDETYIPARAAIYTTLCKIMLEDNITNAIA